VLRPPFSPGIFDRYQAITTHATIVACQFIDHAGREADNLHVIDAANKSTCPSGQQTDLTALNSTRRHSAPTDAMPSAATPYVAGLVADGDQASP